MCLCDPRLKLERVRKLIETYFPEPKESSLENGDPAQHLDSFNRIMNVQQKTKMLEYKEEVMQWYKQALRADL